MEQSGLTRWNVTKLAVLYTLHFQSKEFSQKWNDIEKPKKKSEKRELAQNKWYNQMEQVDTSLSMRNKWNKEKRVSIYVEQVEQEQGDLQIDVQQVEQGQGVCPDKPLHLYQSWSTRP